MTASSGFNFGNVLGQVGQAVGSSNIGGTVGAGEKPEYDFPSGLDKVPESVRTWFMRSDNGQTGLNEFLRNADPKVIDEFRAAVNGGLIRPKNQAANQIIQGYGGLRAGDAVGPGGVLGNLMDDKPSGMTEGYWQQANTLIGTMLDYKTKQVEQSGYLDNMPTLQREQIMGQLAQGWKQQFTNEFLANEQKRSSMAQEGLSQQEIDNQNLQSMAKIMGGTVNPQTGQYQQTEEGRQFDTGQTGYLNGQRTLAGEAQDWSQQKDVANAAANPRDYIYAQMLGNARGGLAGQPATNQLQMPGSQQPGGPNAANGFNPAQWGQQGAGMNPLESTQPPGTSGAGTMAAPGTPGQPPAGTQDWAAMMQQAQGAQDQARQAMIGAQQGPGAGAASGLSPGPGSPQMVGGYPGFQGMGTLDKAGEIAQAGAQTLPNAQTNEYGAISGMDPAAIAARKAAEYGQQPVPTAGTAMADMPQGVSPEYWQQAQQAQQGKTDEMMRVSGQQPQGGMQGLQPWQGSQQLPQGGMGGMPQFRAPAAQGMPGQAPGQGAGMPQPQQGQQGQQFTTSAFTQQLLKNRMVPGSGGIQGQGSYMTQQQMQKQINPNKVRAQDFMRGRDSEQKGFLGAASAAGYSDEDTMGAMKNNMPKFQAPGAGKMI